MHPDEMATLKRLGENLKRYRKQADLSVAKLTSLSGVPKSLIYKVENGKSNVSLMTVYKLCWALWVLPRDVVPPFLWK